MSVPVVHWGDGGSDGRALNSRWWAEKDAAHAASSLVAVARRIEEDQRYREEAALTHARFYANQDISSLYQAGAVKSPRVASELSERLSWNVIQSCVDTAAAKIAKNKPRALFLTTGGDWSQQRRAKNLTKFVDGLFDATKLYDIGQRAFVDACVFDAGFVKVSRDGSQIRAERVLPTEILVDDTESISGTPRTLYQRKFLNRDVLLDLFGDRHEEAIKNARTGDPLATGRASDMVVIYEAWHLPSGEDATDGRHAIAIDGTTLFSEAWTKDYFPFGVMRWNYRTMGFWGQGLAEQLHGIQVEINRTLRAIQKAQVLMSVPRIFVERGSKVITQKVNNEAGTFIEYTGTMPQAMTWQAASPEVYAYLETHFKRAYEVTGISQLSANARKPDGLDAAVAIREFHDVESERFVIVAQRYEDMFMQVARIMVDMARDMYSKGKDIRTKAPGTKLLNEIKWSDVNLKEDQYVLRTFPASILPTSPAAKLQKAQELLQAGAISQDGFNSLMDFPDIEAVTSLANAGYDDVHRIIERIIESGEYETPEPYMPLDLAIKEAQAAILKARCDHVPDGHVLLLHQFIDDCKELADQIKSQDPQTMPVDPMAQALGQLPPQGGAGMAPGGPPGVDPMAGLSPQAPIPEGAGMSSPAVQSELPVLPPDMMPV